MDRYIRTRTVSVHARHGSRAVTRCAGLRAARYRDESRSHGAAQGRDRSRGWIRSLVGGAGGPAQACARQCHGVGGRRSVCASELELDAGGLRVRVA
jgi:hypothetical protein